ncbi:calmodulin-binding protein 60 A-like isoform X2 [Impatiens glandulifera]|nr:calmodulin-binding protein 60 A-like isoform X2 [Impatiens glandulifera]
MTMRRVQLYMEPVLEPLIRRVVKEEVDLALRKYLTSMKWSYGKEAHLSESRTLQLRFLNNISLPVFTGTRIEGEDSTSLKVALVDALTEQVVYSDPESSAKVEIVVLEGDFDSDEIGTWSLDEFKNNIVREREGKKPLLTGDALVYLKEGIGYVGEISFTDNSSWTRSRKFRLGARIVDNREGIRVREAKTESFIVRDHRGELYKKHHPPAMHDEVWRLEKIGKDGAFHKRLSREKVNTVKDFLTLLVLDPARLRNILGSGMSAKMWEVTIEHARTCVLDPRLYLYPPPSSPQKPGVVFNIVGQVTGLISECGYTHLDKLSDAEKVDAHYMIISAFKHWGDVVLFENSSNNNDVTLDGSTSMSDVSFPLHQNSSAMAESCNIGGGKMLSSPTPHPPPHHEMVVDDGYECPQPSLCSPDIMPSFFPLADMPNFDDFGFSDLDQMDLRYDEPLSCYNPVGVGVGGNNIQVSQGFCDNDHLQYLNSNCALLQQVVQADQSSNSESQADLHNAVNSFLVARSTAFAHRRWKMLFCAMRLLSIRRLVSKRRSSGNMKDKNIRYC